jgi:hypothetical protein
MFSLNRQYIIEHLSTPAFRRPILFCLILLLCTFAGLAQDPDSISSLPDTLIVQSDTLVQDSLKGDSSSNPLEAEVTYSSDDSLTISMEDQKVYLYRNAVVNYQNISLKADYVAFSMHNSTVEANGVSDTSGLIHGKPMFSQGSEQFDSDTLRYNFKSRKGIIKYIISKQGEGFLHSDRTKRQADGEIHVSKGKYTTCEDPHPHFYIRLTKAIVIPDKKIVSGPAYMVLADIPLPLALPFGFFPSTTTRASGLIIPTYGEETTRGFYLRNGGWYLALGDHLDLTVMGSVFSRGTWGLSAASVYRVRYKYNGRFSVEFMKNKINDIPDDTPSKDFRISWTHTQDAKANPTRKFSANVNFSTSAYEKRQSYNISDYLTNTKTSSISYSKTWPGSPFSLNANLQHSQNSKSKVINLTLPAVTLTMNRIYPFRGKNDDGKYNWFEKIYVSYNSKLENRISAPDSTFFSQRTLNTMNNGFSHSIPISLASVKVFKYINISPTVSYNGVMYTSYIHKHSSPDTAIFLSGSNYIVNDTIRKLTYAHALSAALSISAAPKIYGTYTWKNPNAHIIAIRHVMTPSVGFSFLPDMSGIMPNYYHTVASSHSITRPVSYQTYSQYQGYLYGTPTINGRSGSVSLSLNNTVEMKVREKTDSAVVEKKVSILDNLNFTSGYNPFAKDFRWSPVNMSGATKLFNKKLDLRFGASFDPYDLDTAGKKIDRFLINEKGRVFRTTRAFIDLGFTLKSGAADAKDPEGDTPETEGDEITNATLDMIDESTGYYRGDYVNFDIPWSLGIDYTWSYSKPLDKATFTHTIRLNGDLSLTPKWKIGMNTGYDFIAHEVTTTNFSINRDLHCWKMSFTMVPFGDRRSFSFTINANSSILRDVKYNKSKSWYDYF